MKIIINVHGGFVKQIYCHIDCHNETKLRKSIGYSESKLVTVEEEKKKDILKS